MFNVTGSRGLTLSRSNLAGISLFNRSIHTPRIYTKDTGAITSGTVLTHFPAARAGAVQIVSQLMAAYPPESVNYSPLSKLPKWLINTAPPETIKYLTDTRVVPDNMDDFTAANFLDWHTKHNRLFFQNGVVLDLTAKTGDFIGEGYAAITTTMINSDGKRENTDAIYVPGSQCSAFLTRPKWIAQDERFVWYEGIKGQFAGEELIPYLFRDIFKKNEDAWWIDLHSIESGIKQLAYRSVQRAIPAPTIYIENYFSPDVLGGWHYRNIWKTRFPNFKIGTAIVFPGVNQPAIDVHQILTNWLDPFYGVGAPNQQFLLSLKLTGGALNTHADSPLAKEWLRLLPVPFSIQFAEKEKWLKPRRPDED